MVQLYVAEGVVAGSCFEDVCMFHWLVLGVGGGGLSEDVAEHYKQLIRVQVQAEIVLGGTCQQLSTASRLLTKTRNALRHRNHMESCKKHPKRYAAPPKRCTLSPRLKRDCVVAKTPKSDACCFERHQQPQKR